LQGPVRTSDSVQTSVAPACFPDWHPFSSLCSYTRLPVILFFILYSLFSSFYVLDHNRALQRNFRFSSQYLMLSGDPTYWKNPEDCKQCRTRIFWRRTGLDLNSYPFLPWPI
jgi:hypothetical protein